jgi:hypothetical protein
MQRGENETEEGNLGKKKSGIKKKSHIKGLQVIGILIILLAVEIYQSNALVAIGVGVLGLYLALGGKV